MVLAFLGGASGKEPTCQGRRHGFRPWVGKIPWRRKWHPTPVSLPGKSRGQRSLAGYSQWGQRELDTTEATWHTLSPVFLAPCGLFSSCSDQGLLSGVGLGLHAAAASLVGEQGLQSTGASVVAL